MILVDQLSDPPKTSPFKSKWCFMASDSSLSELHAFAEKVGLKRHWFLGDSYELTARQREKAVELGAASVTARQLVDRMVGRRRSAS